MKRTMLHVRRNAVAYLALLFALTGSSYAATTKLLPANSVGTRQVIDRSLLKRDFKGGQLPHGAPGPRGAPGPTGPRGVAVVARARSTAAVVTTDPYPGKDIPLSGSTWTQKANELDLVLGTMTYQSPSSCPSATTELALNIYVDGNLIGTYPLYNAYVPGATTTLGGDFYVFEPGADTGRTLTAKVWSACGPGNEFTITDLKLDVVAAA